MHAQDWLATLFAHADGLVELRACPNVRDSGRVDAEFTRDADDVAAFVERWSGQPYGVYFGCGTRVRRRGRAEDVGQIPAVWADLDGSKPLDALVGCYCPPTFVVDSGHGLHPWWLLDEAATAPWDDLLGVLKGLRRVFAGDPAVCDVARIMRLPGTLNTKDGDTLPVTVIHSGDRRYSLSDLQDWLSWQRELVGEQSNPFAAAAERLGIKPPIDVDQMLADMRPGNIHSTLLRVSASLVASGRSEDEVAPSLLEATRLAVGEAGRKWDWRKEEAGLRQMIRTAQAKFAPVIDLDTERKRREPPAKKAKKPHAIVIAARAAMEAWGEPLLSTRAELWTYRDGYWRQFEDTLEHRLRTYIQGAVEAVGLPPISSTLGGAMRWIKDRPELLRDSVPWDRQGVVVGTNGALVIATGEVVPHAQEHYSTRFVTCGIDAQATCPTWDAFLLENLPPGAGECLQEWFGAALVRGKIREMTKGMVVYGGSRCGKTVISEVVRELLGGDDNTCGAMVSGLRHRFGMQPLLTCTGWIADDAVGKREQMEAELYKHIVTGESISVERKNKTNVEARFDLPVLLTMNNFPIVKDDSDAVYNRSLVLPMSRYWSEEDALPIAKTIVTEELSGVLNWALVGWHRLRERGRFDPPEAMIAAGKEFKSENNRMDEFAELHLDASPMTYIMRNDLVRIFNAWMKIEYQEKNEWGGKSISLSLIKSTKFKVHGDDTNKGRVWVGIRFKEAALALEPQYPTQPSLEGLNHGLTPSLHEKYGHAPRKPAKF